MVILAVDDSRDRLKALKEDLEKLFPNEDILCYSDPMMAGKYAFFNPVDMVFAGFEMKRMSGMHLKKMVHFANDDAKIYLMGSREAVNAAGLVDDDGEPTEPGIDGVLYHPVSGSDIAALLDAVRPGKTIETGA